MVLKSLAREEVKIKHSEDERCTAYPFHVDLFLNAGWKCSQMGLFGSLFPEDVGKMAFGKAYY